MKTSVIFGVMQMLLGTTMKGFNAVYFKRWIELFFDVFTQIALLMALFGFMDILIFIKWTTNWAAVEENYNETFKAQSSDTKLFWESGQDGDGNALHPYMYHSYGDMESTPSII